MTPNATNATDMSIAMTTPLALNFDDQGSSKRAQIKTAKHDTAKTVPATIKILSDTFILIYLFLSYSFSI